MNSLRCASVAREEGLDPLGTAGHYRGFLLVDWPLPWPADLSEVPALTPAYQAVAGTSIRLQGVVPAPGDSRRVVLYHRPPGDSFAGYRRVEWVVGAADVADAAVELVRSVTGEPADRVPAGVGAAAGAPAAPLGPPAPAGPPPVGPVAGDAGVTGDLLVCTHGRRDACCGGPGTALVMELLTDPALAAAGYRVGRTSHTGGHRFAPTAIVLPEGTMWAYLDADLAARVVRRSGAVEDVLGAYRGSTGIGTPALQAVERVAFGEVGWGWLDWRRRGEELPGGRVRLVGEAPDGTRRTWEAEVGHRTRPVPDCGKPLDQARKSQVEPVVTAVVRSPA